MLKPLLAGFIIGVLPPIGMNLEPGSDCELFGCTRYHWFDTTDPTLPGDLTSWTDCDQGEATITTITGNNHGDCNCPDEECNINWGDLCSSDINLEWDEGSDVCYKPAGGGSWTKADATFWNDADFDMDDGSEADGCNLEKEWAIVIKLDNDDYTCPASGKYPRGNPASTLMSGWCLMNIRVGCHSCNESTFSCTIQS
jgi:hypothetical protein